MRRDRILLIILLVYYVMIRQLFAWNNQYTHTAITEEAVLNSILADDYLQCYLGLTKGYSTKLELSEIYVNELNERGQEK